jgi:hypothetical protein
MQQWCTARCGWKCASRPLNSRNVKNVFSLLRSQKSVIFLLGIKCMPMQCVAYTAQHSQFHMCQDGGRWTIRLKLHIVLCGMHHRENGTAVLLLLCRFLCACVDLYSSPVILPGEMLWQQYIANTLLHDKSGKLILRLRCSISSPDFPLMGFSGCTIYGTHRRLNDVYALNTPLLFISFEFLRYHR